MIVVKPRAKATLHRLVADMLLKPIVDTMENLRIEIGRPKLTISFIH